MTRSPVRPLAALAAALAVSLGLAGSAAAQTVCAPGDFCLWQGAHQSGGLYQWHGDDANLGNDRFENLDTGTVVAGNVSSMWNNGRLCGGCDSVATFSGTSFTGTALCIPRGLQVSTVSAYQNFSVHSYRWGRC